MNSISFGLFGIHPLYLFLLVSFYILLLLIGVQFKYESQDIQIIKNVLHLIDPKLSPLTPLPPPTNSSNNTNNNSSNTPSPFSLASLLAPSIQQLIVANKPKFDLQGCNNKMELIEILCSCCGAHRNSPTRQACERIVINFKVLSISTILIYLDYSLFVLTQYISKYIYPYSLILGGSNVESIVWGYYQSRSL